MSAFCFEYYPINSVSNDSCEEHDEGVDYALEEGQRHHIAIGDVADFMAYDRAHFIGRELAHHPCANRYQSVVSIPPRCEGIRRFRRENRDFRCFDARSFGELSDRSDQPALIIIAGSFNDVGTGTALSHPL